ncbi:hypothetical protein XarbCFBP7408_13660 [Xanthomonas arboricola pv. guizotiae]|uniref:Uncharacterized protein n=1 Tax=Xanthomonas arboricola pv. guizotiae TaxID=487867 RepID=A0A2S6ZT39_9XANT|nr:hypothetical protein XarbCFBP7409_17430 [Xanthomonas arboricola pv. guizotiae]PPU22826.1 hypothetical protein XarbCFBP7408_13660 [Xanthomonas arboricola pv. guizotiae]
MASPRTLTPTPAPRPSPRLRRGRSKARAPVAREPCLLAPRGEGLLDPAARPGPRLRRSAPTALTIPQSRFPALRSPAT